MIAVALINELLSIAVNLSIATTGVNIKACGDLSGFTRVKPFMGPE